ncbi:MAG TPA: iron chelate uptake ABC transporter family permease subunit [Clostridiaceae bacterium]|nr:iron chelate uptake ABC transporter family permease subunit [Clostridiaceae bacterium]
MAMTDQPKVTSFSYPAHEKALLSFVRSTLEGREDPQKRNILLTGAIGSGKSTFVQNLLDEMRIQPAGYMTIRHIGPDEKRQGYAHVPAANRRRTGFLTVRHDEEEDFPCSDCFLQAGPEGRIFDLDLFYRAVSDLIDRPGPLVVLDELGGDELLMDDFYRKVLELLGSSSRPVILVWKHDASFERTVSRSTLSEEEKDLLRERRRTIASQPSLVQVELSNGSQAAGHARRTIWMEDDAEEVFLPAAEEAEEQVAVPAKARRMTLRFALMAAGLLAIILLSFAVGWYGISPGTILHFFWSRLFGTGAVFPDNVHTVLVNVRLPRIAMGLLVGSGLSVAGHTFQGIFQNPMASPDVLGASSGAGFGAALAILWGFTATGITMMSFVFGLVSIILVLVLTSFVRAQRVLALILTGIVVSSLFSAGLSLIKLAADPTDKLPAITYWLMGSLNSSQVKQLYFAAPLIMGGLLIIFLLRWQLNVLMAGEDAAATMGVRTRLVRVILIMAATLVTATCVSVSGVIGWVGLVVPHIARMLMGTDNRYSLPASAMIGAGFLVLVDDVARRASTSGIPLGILTAFIGAPFFIYLILRQGRRGVAA